MARIMISAWSGEHLSKSTAPVASEALGNLPDVISCTVQRDVDGLFELDMEYKALGVNHEALKVNNWLRCPAGGMYTNPQYFRIVQTTSDIYGAMTVHAVHVSYNAAGIVAAPFAAHNTGSYATVGFFPWLEAITAAINTVDSTQMGGYQLLNYTDDMTLNAADYEAPVTLKQAIQDAIKDTEWCLQYRDFGVAIWHYDATNLAPRFSIRYGREMTGYGVAEDATEFYTHIYPYYVVDDKCITHNNDIYPLQNLPAKYSSYRVVKALDLASEYQGMDTEFDLGTVQDIIGRWLDEHPWQDIPDELSVDSVPGLTEGNQYELGYIGRIYYTPTQTETNANIVSLTYDVIRDQVTSIGLYRRKKDITDTIAALVQR